jgi:hypothetical protein
MMQADGTGIALRPEHRMEPGPDTAHPGIKKLAEVVAVADFTPAVRVPQDIAALQAHRKEHPGPHTRDKWIFASITGSIEAMIGKPAAPAGSNLGRRIRDHRRGGAPTPDRLRPGLDGGSWHLLGGGRARS